MSWGFFIESINGNIIWQEDHIAIATHKCNFAIIACCNFAGFGRLPGVLAIKISSGPGFIGLSYCANKIFGPLDLWSPPKNKSGLDKGIGHLSLNFGTDSSTLWSHHAKNTDWHNFAKSIWKKKKNTGKVFHWPSLKVNYVWARVLGTHTSILMQISVLVRKISW